MKKLHNCSLMGLKQLGFALLCMLLISFTLHANAETRAWSRIGPEGADISQIVISPSQADTLYAATNPSAFYSTSNEYILKSLNGGDSWVTLPWPGKALSTESIVANRTHQNYSSFFHSSSTQGRTLAVDSSNSDIVYTSLSGFLLKTADSGMNWRPTGTEVNLDSDSFFILNSSVSTSLNALVQPNNDLANSDDGEHWQLTNTRVNTNNKQTLEPSLRYPNGESNIQLISTDPENSRNMYGYTTLRHRSALAPLPVLLYKSIDQGDSWLNITPTGYRYAGSDFVFDRDNSQLIFSIFAKTESDTFDAIIDEGIAMSSHDGGGNWQALSIPATNTTKYDVTHIYIDPIDKNTLYANISPDKDSTQEQIKAIAKSVNSGESWDIIDTSPYVPGRIIIDSEDNKKLFMASTQGVLRSDNGGMDWTLSNSGIQHIGGKLSVALDNSQVMYLAKNAVEAIFDNNISPEFYYKSIDGGQHWQSFMTTPTVTGSCHEFKINPRNNQDIFCLTDENIYQSQDGGEQWIHIKQSNSQQLIRAQDGLSIYLSDSTGTSRSEDNGQNWNNISSINEGKLSLHPHNSAALYYILDNQLYSSMDSGENWLKLETPDNISFKRLLIHPSNPDLMVLYDFYSYLLTEDGGQNWRIVLETFNNGNTEINSFPAEFNYISQLILHPTDLNSVFIKTNTGIYQSSDQGAHWQQHNSGLESYIANSYAGVNLLTSAQDVFADTSSGIFKLSDKVNYPALADCIFNWAEQQKADQYAPSPANSQQWNGYTFRYYSQTNTFLGIFFNQEIHQLQTDKLSDINPQDSIAAYQNLSGCTDTLFKLASGNTHN